MRLLAPVGLLVAMSLALLRVVTGAATIASANAAEREALVELARIATELSSARRSDDEASIRIVRVPLQGRTDEVITGEIRFLREHIIGMRLVNSSHRGAAYDPPDRPGSTAERSAERPYRGPARPESGIGPRACGHARAFPQSRSRSIVRSRFRAASTFRSHRRSP